MGTVKQLKDFEGWQPLGEVNALAEYFDTHRGQGYDVLRGISDSMSEIISERNGLAPYIGELALLLEQHSETGSKKSLSAESLEETNLTALFKDRYGVEMDNLRMPLRIYGGLVREGSHNFFLNYQMKSKGLGVNTFWQLSGSSADNYLNMSCCGDSGDSYPDLTGNGNIAFVPGVEEAITADIEMLIQGQQKTT